MQTGLKNETRGQSVNLTDEGKSKCKITKKRGMALQRHSNRVLTYRVVKQDELL